MARAREAAEPAPAAVPAGPAAAPGARDGVPASAYGILADGSFSAKLGRGLTISATDLTQARIDLSEGPQPLPGVRLRTATYNARQRRLDITADLAIPHVAEGEIRLRIDAQGEATVRGRLRRQLAIPALGNPQLTLSIDDDGALAGSVTVEGADLAPRRLRGLTATGSAELRIAGGRMSGAGSVTLEYTDLGEGTVNFRFTEEGRFAADGTIRITPPFVNEISADLSVDEAQNITAEATIDSGALTSPIPALSLAGGSVTIGYENGRPSGALTDFRAAYAGFGSVTIASATLDRQNRFRGDGSFALEVPMLDEATGRVRIRDGAVSGSLRVTASQFPDALPVTRGTITATLSEAGRVSFGGSVGVELGPAGSGTLEASYSESGEFSIGAELDLTVPGLDGARVSVGYANGDLEGEAQIPINTELLPGVGGEVTVRYRQNRWSGETELSYEADNGKLSGSIRVTVTQTEEGALELGGSGRVTAQLMPRLQGTLDATILPEGGVDISGAIEVTEPLELFPEVKTDRELFRHSQNIPLWAILVAVIRVRAGVRAGIGPGVFRNIRVEGSYTIGSVEADPSFTVSGELFIPAYVEGYVAIGAGLGLDVVLGSLTGGIEAVGTAGLYGAISVVPEISYEGGEWGIEGTATLAAGARLKLGLNAWAEIEALWVTVWEEEWKLAEYVMSVGPDLALQARMSYTFGNPSPPEIEMTSEGIDTDALIREAMPEDGPGPSGAREALRNRAEWQGPARERRDESVPPAVAARASETERPPEPAQRRPATRPGPPAGGARARGAGPNQDPTAAPTPGNEPARSRAVDAAARRDPNVEGSVPDSELPNTDQPRYPGPITLAMLDEPPAPTPRTRAQQQEDANAARQAVELASREATDSDALDNYFPRIKRRFGLSTLGYEGDFQRGFKVVGRINPDFEVTVTETLSGTGIPGDVQQGPVTQITFEGSDLGGDTVGVSMTAFPLGPDHPQGSGPTGQATLMGRLPTDPKFSAGKKYIRGHLLNDNLGGPGRAVNLFPITAQANADHHSKIESYVKDWVNNRGLWTTYLVRVENSSGIQDAGTVSYVNADFVAEAAVLDTRLNKVPRLTRKVRIRSRYEISDDAVAAPDRTDVTAAEDKALLGQQQARAIDQAAEVRLSSRRGDTTLTFPSAMETRLKAAIARRGRRGVAERLRSFSGFGERSEAVLFKAYDEIKRHADKTVHGLSDDEKPVFSRIVTAWSNGLSAEI